MATTNAPTWTIPKRSGNGFAPLSFPQERLFLLDRIMPGLPAYNVPTLVRVRARLDPELLGQAFQLLLGRHEILRTTIKLIDGTPVQQIADLRSLEVTVADPDSHDPLEREALAGRMFADLARRPFDLGRDLLLRVALAHIGPDDDQLLIVLHHMASDHISRRLLLRELDAIYAALSAGSTPALPDLPIQYADFAAWQREQISGGHLEELLEYWTKQLAGAPERLEIPSDRPRPSAQSYRGALREFTLRPELVRPLAELARSERATLFMVLLAAFNTLLHRYTGVEDIVVGTPVSGRRHEEIAKLIGFFSNTLALRTDLTGDPTFTELVARVKATSIQAQIHHELPFERLVEALNPERTESHSPVFQVLFGFDVVAEDQPTIDGHAVEQLPVPGWQSARFDLSIVVREHSDGSLHGRIEYATDLFDQTTIDRLIGHFTTLLGAVAANPAQRLSELPILTAPERQQVLVDWNATSRPYDRRCLHELFAEQAARTPQAIAVVSEEDRISYGELDRRTNQLARELARLGVRPGMLVGICVERSAQLVVAMLGVLKSGAAYVPIEPTYPPQRQEFMLADAQAPVLITEERLLGTADPRGTTVVCIDRDLDLISAQSGDPLDVDSDPSQLAYVIYTSGSTGQPKGVEVTHGSVANLIAYMRRLPGLAEDDVVANLTTPAFDLSVPDWYLPLTTGARLLIIPREATLDGVALGDWLARAGVSFMQATPTSLQLLVDAGWKGSSGLKIVAGGEALPPALADALRARGSSLWHMYGPTETTVWSSVLQLDRAHAPLPLGGPIANTSFYVLDTNRRPVPIGVSGELYIGGDGLARGYRNRPELTAEKFVEDPFADAPGRLYRTGDLVRWRPNGTLEFHGRIDQQVKLRGFRIELGEIEAVLNEHPHVGAAVAVVREDVPGQPRLVAYIVATADVQALEVPALRRLLKSKLPPFMIPSTFLVLDSLPVTPNGKLDRGALPAPDGARPDTKREFVAPEGPVQETLASIWRAVLGLQSIGIDDDFFELGGHSMLVVKMLGRLQDALGIEFFVGDVFEHSTIRELADSVTAQMLGDASDEELAGLLAEAEAEQ